MKFKKIVFFDSPESFENLLPLSYTRPVAEFRVGILRICEKWQLRLEADASFLPVQYLREKYSVNVTEDEVALFVAGCVLPDEELLVAVRSLNVGEALIDEDGIVAYFGSFRNFERGDFAKKECCKVRKLRYVFDIFGENGAEIKQDFKLVTEGRKSCDVPTGVTVIGDRVMEDGSPALYIEEGAKLSCAILNLENGPIYIGKNAEVMEGAIIRGPFALCEHAVVKMGSRVYSDCTFGPYCKVGGELSNAVMFGYSNKAHDGYLGNAVIGEWCNLGAGSNSSNLKNDYSKIRIWNYAKQGFMRTDLQFCGLIMGDHSKAGINTMFNTATVVGVGVNLHGSGFPRQFIPSFQTGSPEGGFTDVSIDKFMEVAGKVMARRGLSLNDTDRHILEYIYTSASRFK